MPGHGFVLPFTVAGFFWSSRTCVIVMRLLAKMLILRFDGASQGHFYGPTEYSDSAKECRIGNANLSAPFGERQCTSVVGYSQIVSSVILLLLYCGPATINRGIRSIVVDSIERETRFVGWSHVTKKSLKSKPFLANCYAPCSVPSVLFASEIKATALHVTPNSMQGSVTHAMRLMTQFDYLSEETSTTIRETTNERILVDNLESAAVTLALPVTMFIRNVIGLADNDKSAKSSADQGNSFASTMRYFYDATGHAFSPLQKTVFWPAAVQPVVGHISSNANDFSRQASSGFLYRNVRAA